MKIVFHVIFDHVSRVVSESVKMWSSFMTEVLLNLEWGNQLHETDEMFSFESEIPCPSLRIFQMLSLQTHISGIHNNIGHG